ncbi:MAG TPA: PaaI family thioesterase [Pyrinomonadaceae bacterium]
MTADAPLNPDENERIREAFERVPFAHLLKLELGEMKRGLATLHLEVRDALRQNNGVVHGGVIASLVDSAAAFAIITILEKGQTSTTVDLTIHYLRPWLTGRATAQARVVRAGRRILTIEIDVLDESEALLATALTSFIRLT